MTHSFRTALFALALMACAWLPGTASAQGVLMGSADLDGDNIAEQVYNNGSFITVRNTSGSSYNYQISGGSWALLYGNFTSVKDLDGTPGAEIPIANGSALRIYNDRTRSMSSTPVSSGSWAICNDPGIPNCVSDMNGSAGAELVLILPNYISVYSYVTGSMNNYIINSQYAILSDGVRDFDGTSGNEIAVARGGDGNINIIYPRNGNVQLINGSNTFGTWWSLLNYANLDGVAGDEIRVHNNSNNRNYRIYPRSGTVSAE
jgi:hypothetical protein